MADRSSKEELISVYKKDNTIFFYDELDRVSFYHLQLYMMEIIAMRDFDEINIVIDSLGGDPCGAYDYIKTCPITVNTYINGYCCSASTLLYLAGENRYVSPSSLFLIHSCHGTSNDDPKLGDSEDDLDYAIKFNNSMKSIYEKETRIPKSMLDIKLKYEEKYFTAKDCIKYGIANKIKTYGLD